MAASRGHFRQDIQKQLMMRAGVRCSNPDCRRPTTGPNRTSKIQAASVGVAAHIRAASPGGPRYDPLQTEDERHSFGNGIWLCELCAALIDKGGGQGYPVDTLMIWKMASEQAALEALERHSSEVKLSALDTLLYINVPRLAHFAELHDLKPTIPTEFVTGIPSSGYIYPQLMELRAAIGKLHFPAIDWFETVQLLADPVGVIVSFREVFWTKNGPTTSASRYDSVDFSDLNSAPHLYAKRSGKKFVLGYDPKFMTTSTATVEFRAGRVRVSGFGIIKKVNGSEIWATPLLIGLTTTPEGRALMAALSQNTRQAIRG